jgi:methyl-accepting chemotaxis protein
MNAIREMKLKTKLILLCLGSLFVFSLLVLFQFNSAQDHQRKEIRVGFSQYGKILESSSSQVFYTLYHNVQAFTKNNAFKDKKAEDVGFVLNELVNLYQIYDAMFFVDANGVLIAANDIGPDGKKLSIAHLKNHNWSDEPWFKESKTGKLTEDLKKKIYGTRVGSFGFDKIIKSMYGKEKNGQHFSAVVDDGFGNVLGVLTTYASSQWVQQEIQSLQSTLKDAGKKGVEITVLAKDGSVIGENTPGASKKYKLPTGHDDLLVNSRISNIKFINDLGWKILLRMNSKDAFTIISSSARFFYLTMIFGLVLVCIISVWSGHRISKQLKAIADTVFNNSNIVSSTSEELAESSAELSEASVQQATNLQQTASSLDEINAMVKQNSDLCIKSSNMSQMSKDAAEKGKNAIKRMSQAMDEIKLQNNRIVIEMENNNKEIKAVIQVITEIEQKTRVINDIVFQTKLLSFNASVEAARAGEHGKGFAVVAQEVGNLAEMSGKSAKEITDLLTASLSNVERIINMTSQKVDSLLSKGQIKIEEGMKVVNENENALMVIVENVNSVNDAMIAISYASKEQTLGLQEITKAMNNLDGTTQTNTQIAHRSSQSTIRLNEQVGSLKGAAVALLEMVEGPSKSTNPA